MSARLWVYRREAARQRDWVAFVGEIKRSKEAKIKRSQNRQFDLTTTPSVEVPVRIDRR